MEIAYIRCFDIRFCMARSGPSWELLRTFLEAVRDGSLSGAARRLGLTQPTAGRHIDALEAQLGLTLFTRSPQGLIPTLAALDLVPHAETMAAAAAALQRAASGEAATDRGTVRITASEIMGCEILPPILARFRRKHPQITLELTLSNRNEDLLRRDADIAVRMNRPTQKALVVRRIGRTGIGLYAHRDYLAEFGTPKSAADLAGHCLIGFDRDDRSFRSVGSLAAAIGREQFGFRCDSDPAQLAALCAGVGIGGCQHLVALSRPELVPLLAKEMQFSLEVWLAMHENLKSTRRVRLLFEHLAEGLKSIIQSGRGVASGG
jgi:DNA-binding transcriptional LysR family regulator